MTPAEALAGARRLIVKIGSALLVAENGEIRRPWLAALADDVARCRGRGRAVILHLVDGTLEDVAAAYRTIRQELVLYGHGLAEKPEIVGLNKIDAIDPSALRAKCGELRRAAGRGTPVLPLSGATGAGVREALDATFATLTAARARDDAETKSLATVP